MILHQHLPLKPWMDERTRRLPGLAPIDPENWLVRDEVFAQQMALRDQFIKERRASVYQEREESANAVAELLSVLRHELPQRLAYKLDGKVMIRPDGVRVALDEGPALLTAGRLVQEDLLILQQLGEKEPYNLTAGILCFPASWKLSEKIGRPLTDIHQPVASYTYDMAERVNRIFDALRVDQPLMRANFLIYTDPNLHQPRGEGEAKPMPSGLKRFVRVERQTLRRLPETQAIVFAIHTYLVKTEQLNSKERVALAMVRPELLLNLNGWQE